MPTHEREITEAVDLCLADGRLNSDAVGWSRQPLHRTNLRGWGRTKRWEYWCVTTPTHLLAMVVSNIDLIGLYGVYFLDYATGREVNVSRVTPLGRGVRLPESLEDDSSVRVGGKVRVEITTTARNVRLQAACPTKDGPLAADITVEMPAGHETLSVVVPWDERRFQYTSKHTARPASTPPGRPGGRAPSAGRPTSSATTPGVSSTTAGGAGPTTSPGTGAPPRA